MQGDGDETKTSYVMCHSPKYCIAPPTSYITAGSGAGNSMIDKVGTLPCFLFFASFSCLGRVDGWSNCATLPGKSIDLLLLFLYDDVRFSS
jgi:hypothetical protein